MSNETSDSRPRFYDELAEWWPLFSPPDDYAEEASDLLTRLAPAVSRSGSSLLELGSGGGSLASHLKARFTMTLTDRAPAMLEVSRSLNPECEHLVADMRTIRLGRLFDVVLVHDAIAYATDEASARATLASAAAHCRPGGIVAVLPDVVRETFAPGIASGGCDAPDGRGLRYLEWTWDPDPDDDVCTVDYAFLLRAADGRVAVEHDRHIEGVFSRAQWLAWFEAAGLRSTCETDPWGRDVFVATPTSVLRTRG